MGEEITMDETPRRHRILFVDDTESHRNMIRLVLEANGFEVETAITGQEALRRTREIRPDLVLLDVMLPDTSGYDVCQELKMDPQTMDIVVVLLSGLGCQTKERVAGLEWGADSYLQKPVDPEELIAHLYAMLRLRFVQEEARDAGTKAEEAHARLAAIMEASDMAIIGTDLDGIIRDWNPAAEALLGFTLEEIRDVPFFRITPPERHEEWQTVWSHHTAMMGKQGEVFPVFVNICPIRDAQGRIIGVTQTAMKATPAERQCSPSASRA
jgi:PAS domain S-box-containing protein